MTWLICGRRSGKSFAMATLAVYLGCFRDWRKYLSPGERAVILLVAADREQAKILHRYCLGLPPLLKSMLRGSTANEINLKGGITIEIVTRSYRTVRGRVALLDEVAFWRDDESANPDSEVLNAVRASMATFGDAAMVIAASSPYSRSGILWEAHRKYFGVDDKSNLVWQAATRVMNPTVAQSFIDGEIERDPASAAAEYGAEFRSDIAEFVALEVLEACTARGTYEIPPLPRIDYVAFCDPSGGSSDSMTLAISHRESDGSLILDAIRERLAPFQPEAVVEEFCQTLKSYRIGSVTGDRCAGEWPKEQFSKRGVTYRPSDRVKSDYYRDMLPLLNSRKIRLLDHKKLFNQLHGLERRTARGGKDSIDHASSRHDDVANAAAGSLVMAADFVAPLNFHVPIASHIPLGDVREIGLPGVLAPAIYGDCSKPGGAPIGSLSAIGDQFSWSALKGTRQ
jgi:hypothetical protein